MADNEIFQETVPLAQALFGRNNKPTLAELVSRRRDKGLLLEGMCQVTPVITDKKTGAQRLAPELSAIFCVYGPAEYNDDDEGDDDDDGDDDDKGDDDDDDQANDQGEPVSPAALEAAKPAENLGAPEVIEAPAAPAVDKEPTIMGVEPVPQA